MTAPSRRDFNHLAAAALGGALTGTLLGCSQGQPEKKAAPKDDAAADKPAEKEKPKLYDENLLLAGDPHVCRGLNQCKNQGKDHKNECAGQGACATADKHGCDGLNVCKGQGGCGGHPGQNECKGQGGCAVPLKDATWKKARAKFEQLMAAQGKSVGPAPAKEG
ncbi:MAG TPA: hypothetical protein VMF30_18920 [Pirellulales bacterium]|nr:hypothetical protein [Pirellulales bacterium]